ncbi:MAG: hypothetical protein O7E52_18480 [Candidatus Poribacteria bacterium]|nr:hypothetical protein [Candidatus Poribacteria bacterium]
MADGQHFITPSPPQIPFDMGPSPREGRTLPTVAALCSVYHPGSHSQHTVDRFLMGYEYNGRMHYPPFRVVSMYVDQKPKTDLSQFRTQQYDCQIYPDITSALTLGTGELAVDNVLLVCENGQYPSNEKGQILYPRYEFFREMVGVFQASGRSVPVFNDKHLSYDWEKAKWMDQQRRALGFPMLAGSSLPVTWRLPELEFPLGVELAEAVVAYPGGVESYGIHALETLQCMVERRLGGETGIAAVQCLEGEAVWQAAREGRWSRELLDAALYRRLPRAVVEKQSAWTNTQLEDVYSRRPPVNELPETGVKSPVALLVEYRDGLRAACINLGTYVGDFTFAARLKNGDIASTLFFLGGGPQSAYHGVQVHHIEDLFRNHRPNYPVERTLLMSGALSLLMDSRGDSHKWIETPELGVCYDAPGDSQYERGPMPYLCPWCPNGRYEAPKS